ncbi:uncharacterized protein LOC107040023 [Diachasma alloeum]|uniref:uncharacterized protein LOC107040023 n=1 Tax=Diachasma alloeum TaxID=454923 RepID=UPI0007381C02|nr:uncharacterized protein LOC107040023 [Diachasma alloeum]
MIKLLKFVTLQISRNGIADNILCNQNPYFPRTFYRHGSFKGVPGRLINPKVEAALRNGDQIPPRFQLVYRSKLTNYIYWFYPLGMLSYALGAFGYYYFKFHVQNVSYPVASVVAPIAYSTASEVEITFIFYLLMNTLTLYFLRRTPMRIWLDNSTGEYRMALIGTLPPFRRQVAFKAGEVTRKHLLPKNGIQEVMHRYRGRFYNITSVDFTASGYYLQMVGYNPKLDD